MSFDILDNFNKLKNGNDSIRLNAGVTLLNYLCQHNMDQDYNKELNHMLIRFVRNLGSSVIITKRGFYSTLTVFLMQSKISVEKLLGVMDTQLHVVSTNSKSENADIYMGRILVCGALIRSKLLIQTIIETQQQVIEILLNAGTQRSYLSFISDMFLSEFIIQLDIESMKQVAWPLIEKKLSKPWSEQTLDSFYILLIIKDKHPSLVSHTFLKEHLGVKDIIAKESMEDVIKLLLNSPKIISLHHPVFKLFCEKLMSTEFIIDFWKRIDQTFVKPSKDAEYIAIQILQLIILNISNKIIIPSLLSPNFLRYMLRRFSNCKKNNDDGLIAFREILHLVTSLTKDKDIETKTQLSILKKLIFYPGDLMIEKKTGVKVIQIITGNLRLDGIKKLCQLYRDIIENKMTKRKKEDIKIVFWTNAERTYAAQLLTRLMAHPKTFLDQDWRVAQLIFLFDYGLCEISNVGVELASQLRDSFYRALDFKFAKLDDTRNLLSTFVHELNARLQSNIIRLRSPLNNAAFDAWKKMMNLIKKLEKSMKNTEAVPIFHTMNLYMGLQLFSDPEMAIMSINELQCCYDRLIQNSKQYIKINNASMEEEPHWVEVIVDLLLSLLSRNSHLLRSLVGCVFPHICPYLTPSAVYQILTVLDVENYQDTITNYQKESDDEDSISTESKSDNDIDDIEENISNDDISSEESEFESDSEKLDEDETLTNRLRIAVRQALGDVTNQTDDEDIDIDQIDDDEAKRLDESLATAFKILRENRQDRSKKQKRTSQALTHFRIRVIDLLDIYLETCPSMVIILDMIIPLFTLLEFCIKNPHEEPLEYRVRACLKKLSAVRKIKNITSVNNSSLTKVLKALIEKGGRSASICQEISDKLAECCTFLIRCIQQAHLTSESVVEIYVENLIAFFKKRDCILSPSLFKGVLQLTWEGNWQLAPILVNFAFDSTIRYFRRSQALELLLIFYNNNRLRMDTKYTDVKMELETVLYNNTIYALEELCTNDNEQSMSCSSINMQKKIQQKFIGLLLTLLRVVHVHHLPQAWNWGKIKTTLIMYKSRNILSRDTKNAYNKLVMQIEASLNISISLPENQTDVIVLQNGNAQYNLTSSRLSKKRKQKLKENSKSKRKRTIDHV